MLDSPAMVRRRVAFAFAVGLTAAAVAQVGAGGLGCVMATGSNRAASYTPAHTSYRASAGALRLEKVAVLPLVVHEREVIKKIDARSDWPERTRDALARQLAAAGVAVAASGAAGVAGRDVAEVVEKNLVELGGTEEADLTAAAPEARKVFDAWRRKVMELSPERWADKYAEFATRFADNPFAALGRHRADLLAAPMPFAELGTLRAAAAAAGASHVAIPARLAWKTDPYVSAGVKHRTLDATLEVEIWSLAGETVVWRGHGVFKTTPRFDEPNNAPYLDEALDGAARNLVTELLGK